MSRDSGETIFAARHQDVSQGPLGRGGAKGWGGGASLQNNKKKSRQERVRKLCGKVAEISRKFTEDFLCNDPFPIDPISELLNLGAPSKSLNFQVSEVQGWVFRVSNRSGPPNLCPSTCRNFKALSSRVDCAADVQEL